MHHYGVGPDCAAVESTFNELVHMYELVPDNVLYRVDITLQSKQRLVNKLTECNLRSSPAKSSHLLSIISDISIQVLSFNRSL